MPNLLEKHHFSFNKKYGQNFLQDVKIPRRIASVCTKYGQEAEGRIPALILEIGPGAGILTKELAAVYEKVVAVEIDENLKPVLTEALDGVPNAEVMYGDVMAVDLAALLAEKRVTADGRTLPVSVCANLPYYITTPILMKLIEGDYGVDFITVMVQKEVAARLAASPGSADYGAITAAVGLRASVERLFVVPSGCFYPRPKVDSAVVRFAFYDPPKYTPSQIEKASAVIKAAFAVRRKTLVNALSQSFPHDKAALAEILVSLGLSETVRGEVLPPETFVKLAEALESRA